MCVSANKNKTTINNKALYLGIFTAKKYNQLKQKGKLINKLSNKIFEVIFLF